ncbi:hypothetical protein ES703_16883 [subsurface metagenome]
MRGAGIINAGDKLVIIEQCPGSAAFGAGGGIEKELSSFATEGSRHSPAGGNIEDVSGCDQITLGRYAPVFQVMGTVADCIIFPDNRSVVGAHGTNDYAFEWENACTEINCSLINKNAGSDRPQ